VRHALPVQFGQSPFEVVADQCDGEVGRAFHQANAELAHRTAEFLCARCVDRFDTHPALLEIFLGSRGRQTKARPVRRNNSSRLVRFWKDVTALEQPAQRLMDLVGWKPLSLQFADELPEARSTLAYRGGERTVELAVQKKLAVLGIEAHDVRRQ